MSRWKLRPRGPGDLPVSKLPCEALPRKLSAAEVAGRNDAEKSLFKVNACASAPAADRPIEYITVRYEEKGLHGKETVEQFEGMVAMGNSKIMAMLAHDGGYDMRRLSHRSALGIGADPLLLNKLDPSSDTLRGGSR